MEPSAVGETSTDFRRKKPGLSVERVTDELPDGAVAKAFTSGTQAPSSATALWTVHTPGTKALVHASEPSRPKLEMPTCVAAKPEKPANCKANKNFMGA